MKNSLIDSYKSYAESQGTDYETYITSSGQYTVESFEQKVEEAAQESEKQTMIAEAIADKEKIKLDDKTYKKMLKKSMLRHMDSKMVTPWKRHIQKIL